MKHSIRRFVVAVVMLLSTAFLYAQYNRVNDIPYAQDVNDYAQERCKLDVYYPTDQKDVPVVVWFHGGGIEAGNKHIDPELQDAGYCVIAVNYRLLPKASIDEVLDDAAAAVAWAFKNAEKYNGSRKKIFVAGHSAGGYMLDMIGLDKHYLQKYGIDADSIAGLFPFSGQVITHYNIRKQQGISPLQATIDQYAPLTFVRKEAAPIVIISGDRELELFGRYEEQAYFWRMLKLVGHPDVTLYEMQGFDHGAMPQPAYHVMKHHIKRLCQPIDDARKAVVAEIDLAKKSALKNGAKVVMENGEKVLDLGNKDGYYDLTSEMGETLMSLNDYTFAMYYKVSSKNQLDGYGHFAFACSALAENSADEGPYVAFRLNEQRFEVSTGGYMHEEFVMTGTPAERDKWVHVVFRQKGRKGELFIDGKFIGTNRNMPFLSEIFKEAPEHCWIGRAPFKGDKYLANTRIKALRIYNYALSNEELDALNKE